MVGWFLVLLGFLYYGTEGRISISKGGKLSATHTHDLGLVDLQWYTTRGRKAI